MAELTALDHAQRIGQAVTEAVDSFRQLVTPAVPPAAGGSANDAAEAVNDPLTAAAESADAAAATATAAASSSSAAATGDEERSAAEIAAAVIFDEEPPPALHSSSWTVSADELHTVMAGATTSFVIESFDETGARRQQGGDKFTVALSGAATVRPRVFDEGDGRYTCEFRCPSSGKYRLSVQAVHTSTHLPGSPFTLHVKSRSLKEWKNHRSKEVADLKEKRKAKEVEQRAAKAEKVRLPSPRINPAEQLAKAYELALQAARGGLSSRGHKPGASSASKGQSTTQIL